MRVRTRGAAVAAATAIGLTAASGAAFATRADDPDGDDEHRPGTITVDESTLPEDDTAEQAALAELATVERAVAEAAAVEAVGGGEAASSELDADDSFVVWEVTVRAADGAVHEVTVDAGDASALSTERDDRDDGDDGDGDGDGSELHRPGTIRVDESTVSEDDAAEQAALAPLAEVTEATAGTAAVEAVGGGDVASSQLEDEDGSVVWKVTVRAADGSVHEVAIDAGDARVLGTERDDEDDDDG